MVSLSTEYKKVILDSASYVSEGFRRNQIVLAKTEEGQTIMTSLSGHRLTEVYISSLREIVTYEKKYVRKIYKAKKRLEVGDKFMYCYSNGASGVKVGLIEGNSVIISEYNSGMSRNIRTTLNEALLSVNAVLKERFEKEQDMLEIYNNLLHDIGFAYVHGGSISTNFSEFREYVRQLYILCKKYDVSSNSFVSSHYGSTALSSSRSGVALAIDINAVHHGGYYAGNSPFLIQFRVGGALECHISSAILKACETILTYFTYIINDNGKIKTSTIRKSDGTNWSSVYLSAPYVDGDGGKSYFTLPKLKDIYG